MTCIERLVTALGCVAVFSIAAAALVGCAGEDPATDAGEDDGGNADAGNDGDGGDGDGGTTDADVDAEPQRDAMIPSDAGDALDAQPELDAALPLDDAGETDAGLDSGILDAALVEADAGAEPLDLGEPDAGPPLPPDAGRADAGTPPSICPDADGDGARAAACGGTDCDDANSARSPLQIEQCNGGIDDDCDGLADADDGVCVPCPSGYTGVDEACTDVDECASLTTCGAGARSCANLPGTFACSCRVGYATSAPTGAACADTDECAADPLRCGGGTCVNEPGAYSCDCDAGYRLVGTVCVDVDECAAGTNDCDTVPSALCANVAGGYACACPAGYAGSGHGRDGCTDVDECARGTDDCDDAPDACTNRTGTFTCACPAGYVGAARGSGGCLWNVRWLAGLDVSVGRVAPTWGTRIDYSIGIPLGTTTLVVTPRVTLPARTTILVNGVTTPSGTGVALIVDPLELQQFTVEVIAESGARQLYTFTIGRGSTYIKSPFIDRGDAFGGAVAMSGDGLTVAVGVEGEASAATGVDGDGTDNSLSASGAVYVYRRVAGAWTLDAYLKASVTDVGDRFGRRVALSGDGTVLAVSAPGEASRATGVGGDAGDDTMASAGAVYVFRRAADRWSQESYLKASNTDAADTFGDGLALAGDGQTLAVGAPLEDSAAIGVDGDGTSNAAASSGAVYVFSSASGAWLQAAYLKASNARIYAEFGRSVVFTADASTLVVGAPREYSASAGVDGSQIAGTSETGAVYEFARVAGSWTQTHFIKAAVPVSFGSFGTAVAISGDGQRLAVGVPRWGGQSGQVSPFERSAGTWIPGPLLRASNTSGNAHFGAALAYSLDGSVLLVGAPTETGHEVGVSLPVSPLYTGLTPGAAYEYLWSGTSWRERTFIKPTNFGFSGQLGTSLSMSTDGTSFVLGMPYDSSAGSGIGAPDDAFSVLNSGAVYVF